MLDINKFLLGTLCALIAIVSISSCNSERDCTEKPNLSGIDEALLDEQVAEIEHYLDSLSIDYLSDPSGVRIQVLKDGEGNTPNACSTVGITYTGQVFKDSEIFDFNNGTSFNLGRQSLIKGWLFGLYNMSENGEYRLFIPSPLAYGADTIKNSSGDVIIPGNSNLVFRMKINSVSSY